MANAAVKVVSESVVAHSHIVQNEPKGDWFSGLRCPMKNLGFSLGLASALFVNPDPVTGAETNQLSAPLTNRAAGRILKPAPSEQIVGETLRDLNETIQLLKARKLDLQAQEVPGHGIYNYIFKWTDPQSAKEFPRVVLSDIGSGERRDEVIAELRKHGVVVHQETIDGMRRLYSQNFAKSQAILVIAMNVFLLAYMAMIAKRMGFGESKADGDRFTRRPEERFSDIGGLAEVVGELRELHSDVAERMKGNLQISLPKGILLHGPAGTGKTSLARALAGESEAPFFYYDSSELMQSSFVGVWAKAVRTMFSKARAVQRSETRKLRVKTRNPKAEAVVFVFIDEFESLGMARGESGDAVSREYRKVVNKLLAEMDSIDRRRNKNIIIIAATNDVDIIDPSLLRPGRFSRVIGVPLPRTANERKDILEKLTNQHLVKNGYSLERPEDLEVIARLTVGKSGDVLRSVLEHAVKLANREERETITTADLIEGVQTGLFGARCADLLDHGRQKTCMKHEHGHGVVSIASGTRVFGISNIPRGTTAGRVLVDGESLLTPPMKRSDLLRAMLLNAGGRAAEVLGSGEPEVTNGSAQDLANMRMLAAELFGKGMLGERYDLDVSELRPHEIPQPRSRQINALIKRALDTAEEVVKCLGPEELEAMTNDSIALKREILHPEAEQFYLDRVKGETLERMKRIVDEFIKDPLKQSA